MKYYIPNLQFTNVEKLNKLNKVQFNMKILNSIDGLYKIINNNLYKYKLTHNKTIYIEDYIGSYSLIQSDEKWKKSTIVFHIPYIHNILELKITKYSINPKSKTFFVVEKYNNKIHDFFFESSLLHDNCLLKEDISSFLLHF